MVPLFDSTGQISSLQFISAGGAKRFLKDGRVAGRYFFIGDMTETVCIAEGYATAASIHAATGHAVAVAFSASNLGAVAAAVRQQHPGAHLIVCADNDRETAGNPGLAQARAAARAVGALLAVPVFGENRAQGITDFNDLHRLRGPDAVCEAIAAARRVAPDEAMGHQAVAGAARGRDWPDPEPLAEQLTAHPYPVDALPPLMRDAVKEVQSIR